MKRRKPIAPDRKQDTPQELSDDLLDFLHRKFYQTQTLQFAKDRPRLLAWVVLWPAKWFDERGVTVPTAKYKEIFMGVFMDGLRYGATDKIKYFPAWLAEVIQSHFAHHGEEYYEQAKATRTATENALLMAQKLPAMEVTDPIRQLAQAARLLKPKKQAINAPKKDQLTLL
jgi:hypothetical protein